MSTISLTNSPGEFSPAQKQVALAGNYIDFNSVAGGQWAQQYMPDLYEAEVERYGNRSISSFLRMVGAESPMSADQVIWSEQGRLHLHYGGSVVSAAGNTITIDNSSILSGNQAGHSIRVGQTVVLKAAGGEVIKGYVSAVVDADLNGVNDGQITVLPYATATLAAAGLEDAEVINLFVFGSEFKKGQLGMQGAVEPTVQTFTNNPIILKDKYEVSGSDVSQIGWIEVTGEGGQTGYLWYLKALGDTRVRFEDYLEMTMMEAEKAVPSTSAAAVAGLKGTEGYFAAVAARGHVAANVFDSAADLISDFDVLLQELDKQGAIEENMLFLNRSANLTFDDALASISAGSAGGTAYGVFNNSEDMALNLGFRGFRRGSYDFYKTDWKYLNDFATRGQIGDIKGTLVPAGTSTVYDQILGKNIKRPFLHVRYRASQADNRKMKSWTTGSVGAATSDLDAMEVHFLSERCLVVQGANNFVTFK
jgi:hypothetical protein